MSIHKIRGARSYLYFVLREPIEDIVPVRIGAALSPLQAATDAVRGCRKSELRVLGYAAIGSHGRATLALEELRERMSSWSARDGWVSVPSAEGRWFRRSFKTSVDRHSSIDGKNPIYHVDLLAYFGKPGKVEFTHSPRCNTR